MNFNPVNISSIKKLRQFRYDLSKKYLKRRKTAQRIKKSRVGSSEVVVVSYCSELQFSSSQ